MHVHVWCDCFVQLSKETLSDNTEKTALYVKTREDDNNDDDGEHTAHNNDNEYIKTT